MDLTEANKFWRKAAEQGNAAAQAALEVWYASGEAVPKDDIEAYAWCNIAAASDEMAKNGRQGEPFQHPRSLPRILKISVIRDRFDGHGACKC